MAHDGDAGFGQKVGGALGQVGRHGAQREGVAHRDPAVQAGRLGAVRDRRQLGDAAFAAVVQMDVDADAAAFGDGEDRIEMAVEVAVDADGIEAAQKVGALGDGGVQQLSGARRAQNAALREGHDLDRDQVAEALAHLQDLVEIAQPELVVDVDMAAHVQGAAGHHLAHQIGAGLGFGDRPSRAHLAFGLDAVGDAVARGLVGHPGQAEQGLVEMDVAVDQRRQDQDARLCIGRRQQSRDAAVLQLDIVPGAVREGCVA